MAASYVRRRTEKDDTNGRRSGPEAEIRSVREF